MLSWWHSPFKAIFRFIICIDSVDVHVLIRTVQIQRKSGIIANLVAKYRSKQKIY
jgi:hypothetical protein